MSLYDPTLYANVAKYLSRKDLRRWSLCSREHHQALAALAALKLTKQQDGIVRRLLRLNVLQWQNHMYTHRHYMNSILFPRTYSVGTGTCTGKTAMMLEYTKKKLQAGERVILLVTTRFLQHMVFEYEKFRIVLDLPPLTIAHSLTQPKWEKQWQPHHITLVPQSVASQQQSFRDLTEASFQGACPFKENSIKADKWHLLSKHWDVGVLDEGTMVPRFFKTLYERNSEFYAVNFNASYKTEFANQMRDKELGDFPDVTIEWHFETEQQFPQNWRQETSDHYARMIEKYKGQKTIVLSDDAYVTPQEQEREPSRWDQKQTPIQRLVKHQDVTHLLHSAMSSVKKQKLITDFAKTKTTSSSMLWAPETYLARGFNLHCDTLLCFHLRQCRDVALLVQLLGRVRRIESPTNHVRIHMFESLSAILHAFEKRIIYQQRGLPPSFDARFVVFAHVLANENTDQALRDTNRCIYQEKHSRTPQHQIQHGLLFEDYITWVLLEFPGIGKYIQRATREHVVISSLTHSSYSTGN